MRRRRRSTAPTSLTSAAKAAASGSPTSPSRPPPYIEQKEAEAKCTITVPKAEDWVSIATGKMNPTSAFMQGKIKVKGDMSLAMKLQTLLS